MRGILLILAAFGVWYLCWSVLIFLLYAWDKRAAQKGKSRISEKALHQFAMMGGWPGALLGERLLHHKNQKKEFNRITRVIMVAHFLMWAGVVYAYIEVFRHYWIFKD